MRLREEREREREIERGNELRFLYGYEVPTI